MPSRRRLLSALPLAALASLALAGCGGGDRTSVATRTATVTRTVTVPTPTTSTPTTTATATTGATPPNPNATLSLHAAEQTLDARGYAVLDEHDFRSDQPLKVLVGIRRAPPRAEQAFFFLGDRFIGTDTKDPSGAIDVLDQSADRVTLGYGLYRPGDALCCARAGTAQVTYAWSGSALVPQGTIPTADPGASPSRR